MKGKKWQITHDETKYKSINRYMSYYVLYISDRRAKKSGRDQENLLCTQSEKHSSTLCLFSLVTRYRKSLYPWNFRDIIGKWTVFGRRGPSWILSDNNDILGLGDGIFSPRKHTPRSPDTPAGCKTNGDTCIVHTGLTCATPELILLMGLDILFNLLARPLVAEYTHKLMLSYIKCEYMKLCAFAGYQDCKRIKIGL